MRTFKKRSFLGFGVFCCCSCWVCLFVCLGCFLKINLFIYFCLFWVFVAAHGLSLVAARGGYLSLRCMGFLLAVVSLLVEYGL